MQNVTIERTLIIMPEPLERIFSGRKIWEIRTQPTKIRGLVALSEKGAKQIVGICTIKDCLQILSPEDYIKNARKMGLSKKEMEGRSKDMEERFWFYDYYGWVLSDVKRFNKPIPFANPSGAVTWAKLPPDISRKVIKAAN